jgi:TetR/AcrR family transcriptional regulator
MQTPRNLRGRRRTIVAGKKKNTPASRRRKRGRPHASQQTVGREGIVASARKLLETLPSHRVTTVMIARKAGVDPAMVRYYFASREDLLIAVVENILTTWGASRTPPQGTPEEQLAGWIRGMVDFARNTRSMQRLMLEECAEAKSPAVRKRVRELNAAAIAGYAKLLDPSESEPLGPADPLHLYIAIIGMAEFFVSAQPMILPLLPDRTNPDEFFERYKEFVVQMVLNGLKPRRR